MVDLSPSFVGLLMGLFVAGHKSIYHQTEDGGDVGLLKVLPDKLQILELCPGEFHLNEFRMVDFFKRV